MENKHRFHLISLSHLPQSKTYLSCAFSQKNRKLAKMITSLGHEVIFYGSEGSDVEEYCNSDNLHFVQTHTLDDIRKSWGDGDNRFEIGYDWTQGEYRHDLNEPADKITECTKKFYVSCIENINKVKRPDDFLLLTQGNFHFPIANAVKLYLNAESGIGYRGSNKSWFRCFESQYTMNYAYGSETPYASRNGNFFDTVIGNYFDDDDIEFSDKKEDYFLFCARLIRRKGILEAYLTSKEVNKKLIIVGQCGKITPNGHLVSVYPNEFDIPPGNWEYLGFADIEKRKKLMAHAQALYSATEYLESFAGSHIEALLSGTPVISTNFGVYGGDTFRDGIDGFKCAMLDDFVFAAQNCHKLNYHEIRRHAERYLMDNIKFEYLRWFDNLYQLYLSTTGQNIKGWHMVRKETPLWREKIYPSLTKE